MFKHLLPAVLVLWSAASFAQNASPFEVLSQSKTQVVVKVTPSAPVFEAVETPQGTQYKVVIDEGTPILKKGFPDIEKLTSSLACSDGMVWSVSSVQPGSFTEYTK